MRPIFIIYLTAGIVLTFSCISAVVHWFLVRSLQLELVARNPQGESLERAQDLLQKGQGAMTLAIAIAVTQAVIILSARKLSKQKTVA